MLENISLQGFPNIPILSDVPAAAAGVRTYSSNDQDKFFLFYHLHEI